MTEYTIQKPDFIMKPPEYFEINTNGDVTRAWKIWLQQFEWYSIATQLSEKKPEVQVAVFMTCIGPAATVIYNTFNLSDTESRTLETIKDRFTGHFTPNINETYERYIFNQIIQKDDQSFNDFITDLRIKVRNCGYGTLQESLIRDRIIIGLNSDSVREKLLAEHELTLKKTVDICHSAEQVTMQIKSMKQAAIIETVACKIKNKQIKESLFHCGRCDSTHERRKCPAFNKICKLCNKRNHFTKCCKSKIVNTLQQNDENEGSDEVWVSVVAADRDVDLEDWYEQATMPNGVTVKFKLDSGSQCNVISQQIVDRTQTHISSSTIRYLTSFSNHKLSVLGEVKIETFIKGQRKLINYLVVKEDVTPVLGKSTCVNLKLLKRIEALTIDDDLFEGIGCLKNYKYDIDLVDNPILPICPARKIPHTIRQQVKNELDSMVAQNIIIPVTKPTPAVSPMVVVKKHDKIRICLDPSDLNKNLKRRHYPLNTVEEITARIHGSRWFTLLDCKKGFWQLKLTPRTSEYLTFSTPFGRYSCLRMPFGLASAPEVFQQIMSSVTNGMKNTEVSMDDILIHAPSKEELKKITEEVLEKLKKVGLKLNKEKCVFYTQQVKFLGHIVTSEGIKPDPEKIETITKIKKPGNVKELQRFLGLITYMSKFIKNMADVTRPLRQLLQKNVEWVWDQPQEEAFLKLKELLKNPPVLGYYDPKSPILLSVDASSYACGGVLIQKEKPIAYCAKSFTKTEQGYSQLEKEANAILVACKKFHTYIWGCKDLTIESDHKPLETIFKKPLTCAPPRLQRILYQILPYNPNVIYKKGSEMYVADTLSRDCEDLSCEDLNTEKLQICAIVPFSKTRREELKMEIDKCKELTSLKEIIHKGWPEEIKQLPDDLKKYWHYREVLSVYNDIIFKDDRVLVPKSMVPLIMKHCHLSHKGIEGTLRMARDNVFWPDMTKDLTAYIQSCKACAKIQRDNQMEPIVIQTAPERPWSLVATDLFQLKGKDYILIADSYSGFFDYKELKSITSYNIIRELKGWFSIFGIPDILLSDGGKQYNCEEFRIFKREWNFEHRISSPHFPRSNGLAERYVQEAKNLMKKCLEENTDIQLALLHHRNTPRLDLGSPAQRLFNRRTKTLLPTNERLFSPKIIKNVTQKMRQMKEREKDIADRGKKESNKFINQEKIMMRQSHHNWVPAKIVSSEGHRSYKVQTEDGTNYKRNAWHLKHTHLPSNVNLNLSTSPIPFTEPVSPLLITGTPKPTATTAQQVISMETQPQVVLPALNTTASQSSPVDTQQYTTRSGRVIVAPARYR